MAKSKQSPTTTLYMDVEVDVNRKYYEGEEVIVIGGPHQGKKATYLHPTHAILCEDGKIIHVHPFDLHDSNNPSDLESAQVTTPKHDSPLQIVVKLDNDPFETFEIQHSSDIKLLKKISSRDPSDGKPRGDNKRSRNK